MSQIRGEKITTPPIVCSKGNTSHSRVCCPSLFQHLTSWTRSFTPEPTFSKQSKKSFLFFSSSPHVLYISFNKNTDNFLNPLFFYYGNCQTYKSREKHIMKHHLTITQLQQLSSKGQSCFINIFNAFNI